MSIYRKKKGEWVEPFASRQLVSRVNLSTVE